MQFYSLCLTNAYYQFMGNCSGINQNKSDVSMQSSSHDHRDTASDLVYQTDPPSDLTVISPPYQNNEMILKLNLISRVHPCKIPILKDSFTRNDQLNPLKGSYRSVLFDRSLSSHIPMSKTNVDCSKSVPTLFVEGDLSQGQVGEPGIISNVIESGVQLPDDDNYVTTVRSLRPKQRPANIIIRDYIKENVDKVSKNDIPKMSVILPEVLPSRHSLTTTKSVTTYNVNNKSKRPHSLSTEAEIILNQSLLKNTITDRATPLVSLNEESSVMQDVASLKLMLHKLKRYLTQDGYEGLTEAMNDCLFRVPPSPVINVKTLSRIELEKNYELLLAKNCKLERLLESREMLIVQLRGQRRSSDKVVHSALGDTKVSGNTPRCKSLGLDNVSYQHSNTKLSQGHVHSNI